MCRHAKLMRGGLEMFNFMYHLGWTMVPIYLIKHYSRCLCVGTCGWNWHRCTLSKIYIMGEGLMLSLEGLHRTEDWPPWARGICASRQPLNSNSNISSSLLHPAGPPCRFSACQPPYLHEPIPQNKSLTIYSIHILLVLFLWLTHSPISTLASYS